MASCELRIWIAIMDSLPNYRGANCIALLPHLLALMLSNQIFLIKADLLESLVNRLTL